MRTQFGVRDVLRTQFGVRDVGLGDMVLLVVQDAPDDAVDISIQKQSSEEKTTLMVAIDDIPQLIRVLDTFTRKEL